MLETIPAGSYVSVELKPGDLFRLVQVEGQQVADIVAIGLDSLERSSMYATASHNGRWDISTGHDIISTHGRTMYTIRNDTRHENYVGGGFCNVYSNMRRFGVPGDGQCLTNLNLAGEKWGISLVESEGDTCFNAFMKVEYRKDGTKETVVPGSVKGDELVFESAQHMVLLISNCPQIRGRTNAGRIKDLAFEVTASSL